jgi:hypothetical protein
VLNADVHEKEAQARGFAEHCAQEREYARLELRRQRDPDGEWIPHGGVGKQPIVMTVKPSPVAEQAKCTTVHMRHTKEFLKLKKLFSRSNKPAIVKISHIF